MEYALQKSNEKERFDADISLKESIFKGNKWHLIVYKSKNKYPKLYSEILGPVKDEKTMSIYVETLSKLIEKWRPITKNHTDFIKEELLKSIYYYIKLELCFNENNQSNLLKKIKENNFYIDKFNTFIEDDLNIIKSSIFIDIQILEYLKQTLTISNDLLSNQVIRCIIMCTNYDLIRKGDKSIIETKLSTTKVTGYQNILYEVKNRRTTFKKNSHLKRKYSIKTSFFASLLALTVGAGTFVDVKIHEGLKNASITHTYKTKVETFTSLGGYTEEEKYMPKYDEASSILKSYSETFETEEGLVRTVEYYQIYDFNTTNELEKYYTLDLSLLKPYYKDVVESDGNDQSYIEIEKITQDLNDVEDEIDYDGYIGMSILLILVTALILILPCLAEVFTIMASYNRYLLEKEISKKYKKILYNTLMQARNLLEQNGLTLDEALRRCDEIIGTDSLDDLSSEYKQIIERYKEIRKEHTDLENLLKQRDLKRILRKRK